MSKENVKKDMIVVNFTKNIARSKA